MLIRMASYKSYGQLMAAPVSLDILKVICNWNNMRVKKKTIMSG